MIESTIETKASPERVWQAWQEAHKMDENFSPGQKGKLKTQGRSSFSYRILDVQPGISFSILWKSLFVRLRFTHTVLPSYQGSEICYRVAIGGLFAPLARLLLKNKIKRNLDLVLKSLAKQLDQLR